MGLLRAVVTAVGLVVVLVLAAAVVGLAVAILAVMVTGALVEEERQVPAPVPARRPANPATVTTPMAAPGVPAIRGKETNPTVTPDTAESRRGDRRKIRP